MRQTIMGHKDPSAVYIILETRIRLIARVPTERALVGGDLDPDTFEEGIREAVADRLVGIAWDGFVIDSVAVAEMEPGQP